MVTLADSANWTSLLFLSRISLYCLAFFSSLTTYNLSPGWGTSGIPTISTGIAGVAVLVLLPPSPISARIFPK